MAYESVFASFPSLTFWLLAAGQACCIRWESSLAEPAFPERDLACLRASRRGLSLHGD